MKNNLYNIVLKSFLISFAVFNLIKVESELFSFSDYCYSPDIIRIELVINSSLPHQVVSIETSNSQHVQNLEVKNNKYENTRTAELSFLLKNCTSIQNTTNSSLKIFPTPYLISIIHKANISHQNFDDDLS